ncbi:DUF3667 domain-containing protein [Novosphingobium sp. MW5]|nr:DUF3667 domain-containing protein [Novosphingobium sp. MW5]
MSEIEAIGGVVEGAMTSRAVEPAHGESAEGHTHESACLNCGTPLVGRHCHECGQAAHVHKTVGAFFHDLLHGVFHFEGKIWRTIPALTLRPGKMTREYIDGRRASYVSPIALFLFCVFLMFAVVSKVGPTFNDATDVNVNGERIQGIKANQQEIARLESERARLVREGKPTAKIDEEIDDRKSAIELAEMLTDPLRENAQDAEKTPATKEKQRVYSDVPTINEALKKASGNPQLAIYKLQSNAYKFAWLLIPISVPFLWLLFPFSRRFGLYDHTVFVTYSLAFMMLLTSVMTVTSLLSMSVAALGMIFIPPVHIYKHVRYTYGLGRFGASWRTLAILTYAAVAMVSFFMAIIAIGLE